MQTKAVRSVVIQDLHRYLNINLTFNPSLNVIYGKNGKGKTTVLHILSNIMELDFDRFVYLQFSKIEVTTYEGHTLKITKSADNLVQIIYNNKSVGIRHPDRPAPRLSDKEAQIIAKAFGGKPTYLPAYRAILEKVKGTIETSQGSDFEKIKNSELSSMRGLTRAKSFYPWHDDDKASEVARKTLQCRDWFGDFIPVIRYPSLSDVIDTLSSEFTAAQGEANLSDRTMLSSVFIGVFNSLVSSSDTPSDGDIEPLIAQVKLSLMADQRDSVRTDDIGRRLSEEIAKAKISSTDGENAALKRVLKLYADTLQTRNMEKLNAFQSIRNFESAVNQFLDDKRLKVSDFAPNGNPVRWREYAYVTTSNNQHFPLSILSSGERQILTMLFSATPMSTLATGLFLIDEPELSLHVDWQRIILRELKAQAPLRQIIVCTHSPEVGADHGQAVQLFSPTITRSELTSNVSEFRGRGDE